MTNLQKTEYWSVISAKTIMTQQEKKHTKLIREKDFAVEVTVELLDSSEACGPHLSPEDAAIKRTAEKLAR